MVRAIQCPRCGANADSYKLTFIQSTRTVICPRCGEFKVQEVKPIDPKKLDLKPLFEGGVILADEAKFTPIPQRKSFRLAEQWDQDGMVTLRNVTIDGFDGPEAETLLRIACEDEDDAPGLTDEDVRRICVDAQAVLNMQDRADLDRRMAVVRERESRKQPIPEIAETSNVEPMLQQLRSLRSSLNFQTFIIALFYCGTALVLSRIVDDLIKITSLLK